ncbi:MAG: aminotransferase class V-fold PLP-dependent enzyme [Nocardioides sp.]
MTTSRRALIGGSLGGGALLLAGCQDDDSPAGPRAQPASSASTGSGTAPPGADLAVPDFDPEDWDSVRAQFPLDASVAQFAAFVLSPHTAQVDAAIDHHRRRLAFDTEAALLTGIEQEERVIVAAAAYTGGTPAQFALTDSTTMGIATMYGGLTLKPGDDLLSTTHDFYSTQASLRLLERRTGAKVRRVTLYDDPAIVGVDSLVGRLVRAITPRTRVVAITWVHSSTGVRMPVTEIGAAIADLNRRRERPDQIVLCVDGVHGFAVVDVDLPDLGCDFLATGTHKWLFGPRGTGLVWSRDWGHLTEIIPSFSGPDGGRRLTPGGYHDFEHRWALAEAFAFHERIGRSRVVARTVEQATRLKAGIAAIDGLRLVTPSSPEVSAGIVCVEVPSMLPGDAVARLRERGVVASATPYDPSYLRLGPSIVTTPDEVDRAVEAMSFLA